LNRKGLLVIVFLFGLFLVPMNLSLSSYSPAMDNESRFISAIDGNTWLEGWDYRQTISITGSAGAGTNYQIPIVVAYTVHKQTDLDDVRFTDNDGSTLLDYWRESYIASAYGIFWVSVTDDLGSNQDIYIYYGNDAVSTTSNGTNTFIMFEDWAAENSDNWDIVTATHGTPDAATWDDTDANSGSVLRLQGGPSNAGAGWIWNGSGGMYLTTDHALMGRIYAEATAAQYQREYVLTGYPIAGPYAGIKTADGSEAFTSIDDDDIDDPQAMDSDWLDTWTTFDITRDGTNAKLYLDNVLEETASLSPDTEETVKGPYLYVRDEESDLYVDWLAVRKFIATEPEAGAFGDEELYSEWAPIDWVEVGEAILIFSVPFDYWALNMILVFGGLILMLVSVCIIAVKVRDRTINNDSGVLLLFLFCVGWGLFIGGTLIG